MHKYITVYLKTLTLFFSVLMPEPGTAYISSNISDSNCQTPTNVSECKFGMVSNYHYINMMSHRFRVNFLCDTKTDGGGWIVIQRRVRHVTTFNRNWDEYKNGFGKSCSDYWLGNKHIHKISMSGRFELRIDMMHRSKLYYANYKDFYISNEQNGYMLQVSGFSGNTVDEMRHHDNMKFSTPDMDNDLADTSCAQEYEAGWWFKNCHFANLNGHPSESNDFGRAIIWVAITGDYDTLDSVEMKIRKRTS